MDIQEFNLSKDTLQLLLDEAIELHQKNQFTEAEEKLKQVVQQDPDHLQALMRMAHVARSKGNRQLALSRFEQVIDKYPQHWIAYIDAAIELRTLKCFSKADQMLSKVIKEDPRHFPALMQLAHVARAKGDHELAVSRFHQVLEKHPQNIAALLDISIDLCEIEHFFEAEKCLILALQQEPDNLRGLIQLARVARLKNQREIALNRFNDVIKKYPQHWISYIDVAIELRELNRYTEAQDILQFIIQNCPNMQLCENAQAKLSLVKLDVLRKEEILQGFSDSIQDINSRLELTFEIVKNLREFNYFKDVDIFLKKIIFGLNNLVAIYYENQGDIYYSHHGETLTAIEEYKKSKSVSEFSNCDTNISLVSKFATILCASGRELEWTKMRNQMQSTSPICKEIKQKVINDFPSINIESYLILILLQTNVGDTTGFLSILKSISEKYQKKIILFMADKPHLIDLYDLFKGEHIFHCYFVGINKYHVPELVMQPIKAGVPASVGIGPKQAIVPEKTSKDFKYTGCHFDIYKRNIGLSSSAQISSPEVSHFHKTQAIENFKNYKLCHKNTVLIAPLSNSVDRTYKTNEIFKLFWQDVYIFLRKNGFNIALNGVNRGELSLTSDDYTVVDIPLSQIIPFVEYGGFFIGARSGLCDLLGFAQCHKKVIYPFGHIGKGLEDFGYEEYVVNPDDYDVSTILSDWLINE